MAPTARIICLATKGAGSNEEARIVRLLAGQDVEIWPFDPARKWRSFAALIQAGRRRRPDLIVLEGSGLAGGAAVMCLRAFSNLPYVISSGDAVAPFLARFHPRTKLVAGLYERLLCRMSAGYIGWTPYLAGRALTFGARRAMSAPGFSEAPANCSREVVRQRLGIPDGALVFGLVGSLNWFNPARYCYGVELVRAAALARRDRIWVVIVGDGPGRAHIEQMGRSLGVSNLVLTGAVAPELVPSYLTALDVASLPQSVDGIGAFRYTTKLSEYVAARLPVVTSQTPAAYDLDDGWLWRLPGDAPWEERYVSAMAALMASVEAEEIALRRERVSRAAAIFDPTLQNQHVTEFVREILNDES